MTALSGLWHWDGRPDAADGCARMLSSQQIYAPKICGQWSHREIALGRRLFPVLPEDVFDRQPLKSDDGRYVLVADIRLDNRHDLTNDLRVPAPRARVLCDAAVLLAVIERWERSFIDRIAGDYAFALWDNLDQRLVLARDPLGQRPLHYHRGNRFFAFASMPKGLHALTEIPYAPDEDRVAQLLVLMPETGAQSFFRGIERVEPGHLISVTKAGITQHRYWQPRRKSIALRNADEYAEAARELLNQAVRCRLRGAEARVGSDLSGGIDSGAVAATAARILAPEGGRVVAFTAVPREGYTDVSQNDRLIDEGPYAAATAGLYPNIDHVLIRSEGRSPLDALDRSFFLLDRPPYNLCNGVWGQSINDAARERNLKVVLNGRLGNFGLSYDGMELLPELLLSGRWFKLWQEARALVAVQGMRWRGVLATTLGGWCPAPLWTCLNELFHKRHWDVIAHTAIRSSRFSELGLRSRAKNYQMDFSYRPWNDGFSMRLWALRRGDPGNYNKGVLGGWHIDERDPTADIRLLEFCLGIPTEQFLCKGTPRALALRVLSDRLPRVVLENPRRGYQAADWHERLTAVRDRLAAEVNHIAHSPTAARTIDASSLRRMIENWPSDAWDRGEVAYLYRYTLLRAVGSGHFLRRVTGQNR